MRVTPIQRTVFSQRKREQTWIKKKKQIKMQKMQISP